MTKTHKLYGVGPEEFPEQKPLALKKIELAKKQVVKKTKELEELNQKRKDHSDYIKCIELQEAIDTIYKSIAWNRGILNEFS